MPRDQQPYVPTHTNDNPAEDSPYLKPDPAALAALMRELLDRKAAERHKSTSSDVRQGHNSK